MGTTPKLQDQLDEVKAAGAKKFPAELLAKFAAATEKLKASGIERSAKQVGDEAIDATLTDAAGKSMQLSQLWAKGPVVLMWYRGGW